MTRALKAIIIISHFDFRFSGEKSETMVGRSPDDRRARNGGAGLIARPTDELGVLAKEMPGSS